MVVPNRFKDQVAVVTGAGSGIGLGISHRIALEGGTVIMADIDQAALDAARDTLGEVPGKLKQTVVDITQEADTRELMQSTVARIGKLDIVINSAGIVGPSASNISEYDLSSFRKVLDVNLVGSFIVSKHAIRAMHGTGYGRILLLASISGKEGNPGMAGYSTSKAGVIGLTKAIGKEYANTQITINALAPAMIATPLAQTLDPDKLSSLTDKIPMGRLGTIDEVAALACWIVSPEASFSTGAIFDLSGGRATIEARASLKRRLINYSEKKKYDPQALTGRRKP